MLRTYYSEKGSTIGNSTSLTVKPEEDDDKKTVDVQYYYELLGYKILFDDSHGCLKASIGNNF